MSTVEVIRDGHAGSSRVNRVVDIVEFQNAAKLRPLLKPKTFKTALHEKTKREKVVTYIHDFINADAHATVNIDTAGEIFYRLLSLPIEQVYEFCVEYARATGVQEPESLQTEKKKGRGRPQSNGRDMVAKVLYAPYPGMLDKEGKKDTKAGRRITKCMYAYKKQHGLLKKAKPMPWPAKVPRSAPTFLASMFEQADQRMVEMVETFIHQMYGASALKQILRLVGTKTEKAA